MLKIFSTTKSHSTVFLGGIGGGVRPESNIGGSLIEFPLPFRKYHVKSGFDLMEALFNFSQTKCEKHQEISKRQKE